MKNEQLDNQKVDVFDLTDNIGVKNIDKALQDLEVSYVVSSKGEETNMEEKEVITYEQVEERLKDVKLEDYTTQDICDRYIAYRRRGRTKRP